MSSSTAPRCQHIKVNGTQCGSPALRKKKFCFYHQQTRPFTVECYYEGEYSTGEIALHLFEDAHSIQSVLRQLVQMVLQKRIERKTASLLLYALQIASSNLKRMELEKPQPEQVVRDFEMEWKIPIATRDDGQTGRENSASAQPANHDPANHDPANHDPANHDPANHDPANNDRKASPANASTQTNRDGKRGGENLPPGTIQACCWPGPQTRNGQSHRRKKQYVI